MKKTLPIVLENAAIVTECWTFEKLAIIQTSPLAEDWLASHFRLYIDPCFCAHYIGSPSERRSTFTAC